MSVRMRTLSLFLTLLLLLPLAGCGASGPAEEEAAPDAAPVEADASEAAAETVPAEAPVEQAAGPAPIDLGGYSFRIVTSHWYDNDKIIYPEELTGEVINDSVYNANLKTMNDYNCVFVPVILNDNPDVSNAVNSTVTAGLDESDMSFNHDTQTVSTAMAGSYLNIRASDIFNFDAP